MGKYTPNNKDPKIDEDALRGLLHSEIYRAIGHVGGTITTQRSKAIDLYKGNPNVGELNQGPDGWSSVVSRDVFETVEWMMPALMKMFTGGDKTVTFSPVGPEDVDAAEQESDYMDHVIMKQNEGFKNMYTWFKDALLLKNGIATYWWDETPRVEKEHMEGLTDEMLEVALMQIKEDDDLELREKTTRKEPLLMDGVPEGEEVKLHDITVAHTYNEGKMVWKVFPPDQFLISERAVDIEDANLVAIRERKTVSELIAEGYDADLVRGLPTYSYQELNEERTARFDQDEDSTYGRGQEGDETSREVWITKCYFKVDWDNDGIAERRRIIVGGNYADTILDNEEWDGPVPIVDISPIPQTHKFFGFSMADIMEDLQIIKSILLRGALNNLYLTNNQMIEVPEAAIGDDTIADLLNRGPGSLVRTANPGMVREIPVQGIMPDLFAFIELLDGEKENRSGVTRYNQGLDANSLNKTATGIAAIQNAAEQRIELVARLFAEGVKKLFSQMHDTVRRHSEVGKAETVRLRGKWIDIEPSGFKRRMDMEIHVGLGTGAKQEKAVFAQQTMQIQQQILQMQGGFGGMVHPKHVYSALKDMVETGGKTVERYFADPDTEEGSQQPPPKEDPRAIEAQGKMQMAQAEMQAKQQQTQAEMQMKQQSAQIEQQQKTEAAAADLALKREIAQADQARKERESQEENARKNRELDAQIIRDEREVEAKIAIERFEAEQKADITRAEFQVHHEVRETIDNSPEITPQNITVNMSETTTEN
jgi:hypothetical protein